MSKPKHKKRKKGEAKPTQSHSDGVNLETDESEKKKQCSSCRELIDARARVCQHCNRGQGFWGKHFGIISGGISIAAIVVSVAMMVLAIAQYYEARKQRLDASLAVATANTAANSAKEALHQVESDANSIAQLREEISFYSLVTKVSNDDRASFDALCRIEKTENHRFQKIAHQTLIEVVAGLGMTEMFQRNIKWKERHNLDPSEASLADFISVFHRELPVYLPSVLRTIWEQERFRKAEKLDVLDDVINTTKSIRTLHQACKLMNQEANLGKNILGYEQYSKWWKANRESYNKKPKGN